MKELKLWVMAILTTLVIWFSICFLLGLVSTISNYPDQWPKAVIESLKDLFTLRNDAQQSPQSSPPATLEPSGWYYAHYSREDSSCAVVLSKDKTALKSVLRNGEEIMELLVNREQREIMSLSPLMIVRFRGEEPIKLITLKKVAESDEYLLTKVVKVYRFYKDQKRGLVFKAQLPLTEDSFKELLASEEEKSSH